MVPLVLGLVKSLTIYTIFTLPSASGLANKKILNCPAWRQRSIRDHSYNEDQETEQDFNFAKEIFDEDGIRHKAKANEQVADN